MKKADCLGDLIRIMGQFFHFYKVCKIVQHLWNIVQWLAAFNDYNGGEIKEVKRCHLHSIKLYP